MSAFMIQIPGISILNRNFCDILSGVFAVFLHYNATKCNVLNASYAMICKVACCRSHFKTPLRCSQRGFSYKFVPELSR